MSRPVVITPDAREDMRHAVEWYERQRPGLGSRFLDELDGALAAMTERPMSFAAVHLDMRRVMLRRFPYGVFFYIRGDDLVVVGVIDLRRDPQVWRQRRRTGDQGSLP